jgi:hypothetical protein
MHQHPAPPVINITYNSTIGGNYVFIFLPCYNQFACFVFLDILKKIVLYQVEWRNLWQAETQDNAVVNLKIFLRFVVDTDR